MVEGEVAEGVEMSVQGVKEDVVSGELHWTLYR